MSAVQLQFKVVLCGQMAVGKTSLLGSLVTGAAPGLTNATIGVDFKTYEQVVDGRRIKLQFWDTAGTERFRADTPLTWRDARALIFVYDITQRDSYEAMASVLGPALDHVGPIDPWVVVIGNKVDLASQRAVTLNEASVLCRGFNYTLMETSAKDGTGVQEMLEMLCSTLVERFAPKTLGGAPSGKATPTRGFKLGELPVPATRHDQPASVRAEVTPRKASCEC